jgi:hypothetical protein
MLPVPHPAPAPALRSAAKGPRRQMLPLRYAQGFGFCDHVNKSEPHYRRGA